MEYITSLTVMLQATSCETSKRVARAVARKLIGGLNIRIFMLYPIDSFSNQVDFKRN